MKNKLRSFWLVAPLMIWVLNILIALVQHVHAGPGHLIPTPIQSLSTLVLMSSGWGEQSAQNFANWVLIGTGFLSILFAFSFMFDRAEHD